MPKYQIQVIFEMAGTYEVEAASLAEAEEKIALEPLPPYPEYIEDSMQFDKDSPNYGAEI